MPLTPEQLYQEAAGGLAAALALCLLGYLGTKLAAHAWRAVTVGNGYRRWVLRRRRSAGLLLLLGAVSGSVVADAQDLAPLDPAEVRRRQPAAGAPSLPHFLQPGALARRAAVQLGKASSGTCRSGATAWRARPATSTPALTAGARTS